MSFARTRPITKTIRFRLAVWNASAVILTALATLFGLRQGLYYALVSELDQVLVEDTRELSLALVARNYPESTEIYDDLNRKAQAHELHDWYVRFLESGTDQEIWSSAGAPQRSQAMPTLRDFAPITVGRYRVVQYRPGQGARGLTVRVGSSMAPIHEDMSRIDRNAMLICVGLLVVAPVCGYWLAGRATHPFAEMIHTTASLRPSNLAERLPIRGTNDELDQLAQQVNKLLDRMAQYLETKRDFVANAAHELRSPLAAIRSAVEVALNESRTPEQYQAVMEGLLEETASLANLVSQLLFLAETEADCLSVAAEFVQFDDVVRRSTEMFIPVAEDRGIVMRFSRSDAIRVEGNRLHLRQVINNLLENAIKFTPQHGRIRVTLERDERRQLAVLRVEDSGNGIAPEDLPHIFERFFRSDRSRPRDGETRGTGLGLSICKSVVQMHGGTIRAQSQLGKGTMLTVTLPLANSTAPERQLVYEIPD